MKVTEKHRKGVHTEVYVFDNGTVAIKKIGQDWIYERNGRTLPTRYKNVIAEIHTAIDDFDMRTLDIFQRAPELKPAVTAEKRTSWSEVAMAGLFGLAIGGILALTYVYRTGGF